MEQRISLNGTDWKIKEFYGEDWLWRQSHMPNTLDTRGWRAGSVPGTPVYDLWRSGDIPNPYVEQNTLSCEWVSQRTWVYKKFFQVDKTFEGKRIHLHFDGVDYESRIFLNGEFLGKHTGMFTPIDIDVTALIHFDGENVLSVVIEPAPQEQPQVGRTSLVRTHKSRMTYWWDFCPRLVHLGIWDDVYLKVSGPARLENLFVRPILDDHFTQAEVILTGEVDALAPQEVTLEAKILWNGETVTTASARLPMKQCRQSFDLRMHIDHPHLWLPNGCVPTEEEASPWQDLYEVQVVLYGDDVLSDQQTVPFGIRKITLVPNEEASPDALPYTFQVNGRKVYIKGWNWVPIDLLYGVPQPEKLERLLLLAKQAHVNLLRVWGGGLIEKEAFYNLCDRLGIMVWQEFIQSSSGIDNQPSSSADFVEFLVKEAEQIIPKKRNHPALVLWCGGNELQDDEGRPLDDSHPVLSALKKVVNTLDPDRLWLPTSPSGPVFGNSLENLEKDPAALHDVHGPWEYQGVVEQYTLYNRGSSLFHSEFGVEAITNLKTLNVILPANRQMPVDLDINPYWRHLGAWWVRRKVWDKVFGVLPDIDSYVRATQLIQFDGLRYAVEADCRRKYHNSGTIPWQFNEPYPMAACTSAVDYFGNPKPAYYAVAMAYEPVHVSAKIPAIALGGQEEFMAEVWGCNSLYSALEGLNLQMSLIGGNGEEFESTTCVVSMEADRAHPLARFHCPMLHVGQVFFFDLKLWNGNQLLSENRYVFTRTNDLIPLLHVPSTHIEVDWEEDGDTWTLNVTNHGQYSALFLWLEEERIPGAPGWVWLDQNYRCLFPRETLRVKAHWKDVPAHQRLLSIRGWNTNRLVVGRMASA